MIITDLNEARQSIRQGAVLAYPTEAVYGLGCDPFNEQAVQRILQLKQRSIKQGLIIIIADWTQLFPLIAPLPDSLLDKIKPTWPGPITWVFEKSKRIPTWISGQYTTIAIRMTAHPIAAALCQDGPIVSTSANLHGQAPACDLMSLQKQFPQGIDAIVSGALGEAKQPSAIYDAHTGERLR